MADYDPVLNPGKVQCHVEKEYSGHKTPFFISISTQSSRGKVVLSPSTVDFQEKFR